MLTKTILIPPDCMDHFYMLIGCNLDKLADTPFEQALSDGLIDIDFEAHLRRFLKDFGPDEMTDEQCTACAEELIQRQQNGNIFRYNVSR